MEEVPFRVSRRSTDNDVDEPVAERNPAEQSNKTHVESKSVHRSSHNTLTEKKSKKPIIIAVVALVVLVLVGFGIWKLASGMAGGTGIDNGKYQAVFFTNGQVYFGKLQSFNNEYMKLTDVYYLQTQSASSDEDDSKNPQQTANDGSTTLIKLGDEVHGPEDEMIISKDQVLFYENLKTDGKVSQSIEKYKNPN